MRMEGWKNGRMERGKGGIGDLETKSAEPEEREP